MGMTNEKRDLLNRLGGVEYKVGLGDLIGQVVKAGLFTTVGGDATEVITVTGAAVGDVALGSVITNGVSPCTVATAKVTATNTLTVVLSADPSTDHVLNYVVLRSVA